MQKLKTYVLIVSKTFPATHINKGQQTGFVEAIKNKTKQTTIRQNYGLWAARIKEVQEGKAVLSVRSWTGRPYNSKQVEHLQLTHKDGVGVEKVEIGCLTPRIERGGIKYDVGIRELAEKDGLTVLQFADWFKKAEKNQPLALIYLTDFRHNLYFEC